MPAKRRKPRKKKNMGFNSYHVDQFRHGFDFHGFAFGDINVNRAGFREFQRAWEIFRDDVLADWIRLDPEQERHACGPGTRPYAWWRLDAPEPRQRVDGGVHPFDDFERTERLRASHWASQRITRTYFGLPSLLCSREENEAIYETQAEYIERLNLWLPGEKEMLP